MPSPTPISSAGKTSPSTTCPATCANAVPQALTHAQLNAFSRDSFVKGIRVFADEEIADIRAYFDALLARVLAEAMPTPSTPLILATAGSTT